VDSYMNVAKEKETPRKAIVVWRTARGEDRMEL
jgi:hypothetical protein